MWHHITKLTWLGMAHELINVHTPFWKTKVFRLICPCYGCPMYKSDPPLPSYWMITKHTRHTRIHDSTTVIYMQQQSHILWDQQNHISGNFYVNWNSIEAVKCLNLANYKLNLNCKYRNGHTQIHNQEQ